MEKKLKGLFKKVIKKLKGKYKEFYVNVPFPYARCKSRDGDRFTVLSLQELADNHVFDDLPQLFGISKIEGHLIRGYFQEREINNQDKEMLEDFYREFPGVFEGESRRYILKKVGDLPPEGVPLFD